MKPLNARMAALLGCWILMLTACGGGGGGGNTTAPASTAPTPTQPASPKPGPDAPTGVAAAAKSGMASVSFVAATAKDGSAITGYTVRSSPPGGTDLNAGSTALNHLVAGLSNGTSYTFTVTANSATGASGDSSPSNAVTPVSLAAASWSLVGSLSIPRERMAAVLLMDGRVLVTGGFQAYRSTPPPDGTVSAELYNPVTQTWTAAAAMGVPRWGHTATLLPNGKVLVVGGAPANGFVVNPVTGKNTPTSVLAELYDPISNSWTPVATGVSRIFHTATLLPNGKVLIVGGQNDADLRIRDVDLYDPATNALTHVSKTGLARSGHKAMLLSSGKVLVIGGYFDDPGERAERYSPSTDSWETLSDHSPYFSGGSATLLPNGKILTVTGARYSTYCNLYDPETLVRSDTGCIDSFGSPRATGESSADIVLGNGKVLLVGGWSYNGTTDGASLFDPATNSWSSAGAMPQGKRTQPTLVALRDGSILVIGGALGSIAPEVSLYVPL